MKPHREDPLTALLAQLPGDGARRGFTDRVMVSLDRPRRAPLAQRLVLAGATAALLLAALWIANRPEPGRSAQLLAEARAVRLEYTELERELAALRALAQETAPVVYLDQQDEFDLVLDLRPLLTDAAPTAQPASYGGSAPPDRRRELR